jgi:zinc protease
MKNIFILTISILFAISLFSFQDDRVDSKENPPQFSNGNYEILPNGLQIYAFYSDTKLLHIVCYIRAGEVCGSDAKKGVATLTFYSILTGGTKNFPKEKLDSLKKDKGIEISTNIDYEWVKIEVKSFKEDYDLCLNILKEFISSANLDEKSISDVKNSLKKEIGSKPGDASKKVYKTLFTLLYGDDTIESQNIHPGQIEKISREDIVAFYKKFYSFSDTFIGVTTSMEAENLIKSVKNVFGTMPSSTPQTCPYPDKNDNESIVTILQKVDAPTSLVGIGKKLYFPKNRKIEDDFPVLDLMSVLLASDSPSARLLHALKFDRNLSQNVIFNFYFSYKPYKAYFTVFFDAPPERTGFATYLAGKSFADIITNPPTEGELKDAKNCIKNKLVEIVKDPQRLLYVNSEYLLQGFPKDYLNQYWERILKATQNDVVDVCREYLSFTKYQYVIFGPGEKFVKEFEVFGKIVIRNAEIELPI